MSLKTCIAQGGLSKVDDETAIKLFAADFENEFRYLKNAIATVESCHSVTLGDLGTENKTPSRFLFGRDFAEVNRTLISMLALKWLLADKYESFTKCQRTQLKLTLESFRKLRRFFLDRLQNPDDIYALLVATVINDIGKDLDLAKQVEQATGHSELNHDEVSFFAVKLGLLHSTEELSFIEQQDLLVGLEFGSKCNIAQLVQGESVPGNLQGLRKFQDHQRGLSIKFMEILLDVAGAGAQTDARGCRQMDEPVFQMYMVAIDSLDGFIKGVISSERDCYDRVLASRIKLLGLQGLLSIDTDDGRALVRILAMGRVIDKKSAELFQEAFNALPSEIKKSLVEGLNVAGISDGTAILPYYAPGLLAEAIKNTPDADGQLVRTLSSFMRFLTRALDGTRRHPGELGVVVERDLSFAKHVIKSEGFWSNPELLSEISFPWKKRE